MKSTMIREFDTENFYIRPINETDADFVFENWTQEVDVAKYMTWKTHQTVNDTESYIQQCLKGWDEDDCTWIIEKKNQKEIIGSFAARRNGHKIDIGYLLVKKHWGNGYMPEVIRGFVEEAFKIEGIYRIWAVCDVDNLASRRAMVKGGLSYEGTLKSWLIHPNLDNQPRDCFCLGLSKSA